MLNLEISGIENFTFENYTAVQTNREVYAAAKGFVEHPRVVNPLCIYSQYRVGKTHLLKAIFNACQDNYPDGEVAYFKLSFYIHGVKAYQADDVYDELLKAHAKTDILLLDDVEFAVGDEWRERELVKLVKTVIDAGNQVVLSSKLPFGALPELDAYLQSLPNMRMIRISALSKDERRELFVKAYNGFPELLLSEVDNFALDNPGEVNALADRIRAYQNILHKPLSVKLMKKALRDCKHRAVKYDPEEIIDLSAKLFSVTVDEVKGPTKYRYAVLARMVSMYLIRKTCGLGYGETGEFFSKKNPVSPYSSDLDGMADKVIYRPEESKASRRRSSLFPFDDDDEDEPEDEDEV